MTTIPQPYPLASLAAGAALAQLMRSAFNSPMTDFAKIGRGFYADVYRVVLLQPPHNVVVKWHKYRGYSAREREKNASVNTRASWNKPRICDLQLANLPIRCNLWLPFADFKQGV